MEEFVSGLRGRLALNLLQDAETERRPVTVVVGNESCDLDSAVSAIVLAYFLHTRQSPGEKEKIIVPVLNVSSEDLPLKTDVTKVLLTLGIQAFDIPRLDEIDFSSLRHLGLLSLVLVDHHNLFDPDLEDCIEEIIDHRPVSSLLPKSCTGPDSKAVVNIKPVGSCATLVLKRVWEINPDFRDTQSLRMIRFAIITDTVNFSESAKKTTEDDLSVMDRIDLLLGLDTLSRTVDYQLVLAAKTDLSGLSTKQILQKDLKVVKSTDGDQGLAFSSAMTSAADLAQREDFIQDATAFLKERSCQGLVVMGMVVSKAEGVEHVQRDMVIFPSEQTLCRNIVDKLPGYPELKLEGRKSEINACIFNQGDVSYSRKKVMPIIKEILGFQ